MEKAKEKDVFKGLTCPNRGPSISHLLFADDAIILGEWTEENIRNMVRVLRIFHIVSGLRVNIEKCCLFGLNVDEVEVNRCLEFLHCKSGSLPFNHLGILVGANMNRIKSWDPVIEVFERRLSLWKASALSMGGRLVLLKSVLDSLPIYFFSLFKAPQGVIDKLEGMRMRFLWGGSNEKAKVHWVNRVDVCKPLKKCGLGLNPHVDVNRSLLANWIWRYKTEPFGLWRRVVYALHESNRAVTFFPFNKQSVGVCREISRLYGELMKEGINLRDLLCHNGRTWCWTADTSGEFSTKSMRKVLFEKKNWQNNLGFVWCKAVPKRINTFGWKLQKGRLATVDELERRNMYNGNGVCKLCDEGIESVTHLFTACYYASLVWNCISAWCHIPPIYAFDYGDLFVIHKSIEDKMKAKVVHAVMLTTC